MELGGQRAGRINSSGQTRSDQIKTGESNKEDQIRQNHIRDSGTPLCERILLLRGGGEEGTNDEEKPKGKKKNPAGDREAKDSEDKERPRRFAAQQQEHPLKWGGTCSLPTPALSRVELTRSRVDNSS